MAEEPAILTPSRAIPLLDNYSVLFPMAMVDTRFPLLDPDAVASRMQRFDASRDPAELWPGLRESDRIAASREIERVTRIVLSGNARPAVKEFLGDYALLVAAHTTGMGPVLGGWIERGIVDASPRLRAPLLAHIQHSRLRTARIERELLPALDAILLAGITPLVLKGFHTARTLFEEPGERRMSDVDLFVHAAQLGDASCALANTGFVDRHSSLVSDKHEWVPRDADERTFSLELSDERSPWVLELHTSLQQNFHRGATAALDPLAAITREWSYAGRPLRVLTPAAQLVTLAAHCSRELDSSRLLRLYEIILLVRHNFAAGALDWTDVIDLLERTHSARFVYPALALAEQLAPGTVHRRVLEIGRAESTWAARHTVSRLVPAGGAIDELGFLRQVMWARGATAVLQRLQRFLWPAPYARLGHPEHGWRIRLRQLRAGRLSLLAPDERREAY